MTSTRGRPLGGPHPDDAVLHHEVAAFDERNPHLLRQEAVFEVGGVVHAGSQQHDGRLPAVRGAQSLPASPATCRDSRPRGECADPFENPEERCASSDPGFPGHRTLPTAPADCPPGHRRISVAMPNQIGPGDMAPDPLRRVYALTLWPIRVWRSGLPLPG